MPVKPVWPAALRVPPWSPAAGPWARRVWRGAVWAAVLGYFGFAALVLVLRYAVLPNVEAYRDDIQRLVGATVGLPVTIGRIEAGWQGLRPELSLYDVRIADRSGRQALAFDRVDGVLSWWSVPSLKPQLHSLLIEEPTLQVRREADGRIFVAGILVAADPKSDTSVADWVLHQHRIVIRGATILWEDALRKAPPLTLDKLDLRLDNDGRRHRFGLTALPPPELASRIDLRGDLRGASFGRLEDWQGALYAEVEQTDLAGWSAWFDYPIVLPRGRGGVRAWLDVAGLAVREATADIALADVVVQLGRSLPRLDLERMQGRLSVRLGDQGEVSGRKLEIAVRGGVAIPPTDFHVDWKPARGGGTVGHGEAGTLDLGALVTLADYLPLDAATRRLLADHAPRGRIEGIKASWEGDAESLRKYSLQGRFSGLGLNAQGRFPGFHNVSGAVDASEAGGSLSLAAEHAAIDLPAIFPESRIPLDRLDAQVGWKYGRDGLRVELSRAEFANGDATGASARGVYTRGDGPDAGPGTIDLTARIERADGRAVWRYLPHVVNREAREWLRRALVAGTATGAELTLRGDLAKFPFKDPKDGLFLVTAKVAGAGLDYAEGWPRIDAVAGSLRFEGAGMRVDATQGTILGARITQARADIPDFDAAETLLLVNGKADGPTAEFLHFIEASPVGAAIDHFTEDARAEGSGRLDIGLRIPLHHAVDTEVQGDYQFIVNQIAFGGAVPPMSQVNGRLSFTQAEIHGKDLAGTMLGGPVRVAVRSQADKVLVDAQGTASVAQARKLWDSPLFDNLSGSAAWRGDIRVRKKRAELLIESDLKGVASSLPEPFNKSALDALPLRIEKVGGSEPARGGRPAVPRETLRVSLGKVASLQLVRRADNDKAGFDRGVLALGERSVASLGDAPKLPDHGLAVAVAAAAIDVDFWRRALAGGNGGASRGTMPLAQVGVRADVVDAFGRRYHDVALRAQTVGEGLQLQVNSREVEGGGQWQGAGKGRLQARLKRLALPERVPGAETAEAGEALKDLPGLDVVADSFSLGKMALGRLELLADNAARVWQIQKLSIANPDGTLTGSGNWQTGRGDRTELAFKVVAPDSGKLLGRLGYPEAVQRGPATLEGKLGWNGVPTSIDYGSLGGEMKLAVEKGQFRKLEPGIGKLLGLLSLQSLPRRITLDFRDVFSEGFAFDAIAGSFAVQAGIMRTDDLVIDGPAARVLMRGDVDLQHETQKLRVTVQPELGGTVALGAAIVNPVVGLATLLAHKVLQNPLNQVFAFEYLVTGTWDDPKVEKVAPRAPVSVNPMLPSAEGGSNEPAKQ